MTKTNNSINMPTGTFTETQTVSAFAPTTSICYTNSLTLTAQNLTTDYNAILGLELLLPQQGLYEITANIVEDSTTITSCPSANSTTYQLFYGSTNSWYAVANSERSGTSVTSLTNSPTANNFGINTKNLNFKWMFNSTADNSIVRICGKTKTKPNAINFSNPGYAWNSVQILPNGLWFSICSSQDGKYILAVDYDYYLHVSNDYGSTWTTPTAMNVWGWRSAMSTTGQKMYAATNPGDGDVWYSSNYGVTWTQNTVSPQNVQDLCCSADGTKVFGVNGSAWVSLNSGVTWTQQSSGSNYSWTSICCSTSGNILYGTAASTHILKSVDSGTTWTQQTNSGQRNWLRACCSADGTKVYAIAAYTSSMADFKIWKSTDSGVTWNDTTTNLAITNINTAWQANQVGLIVCDSTGTKLVTYGEKEIWTSINSGASWTKQYWPFPSTYGGNRINCLTSSADGNFLALGTQGEDGQLYGHICTSRINGGYLIKSNSNGKSTITVKYIV